MFLRNLADLFRAIARRFSHAMRVPFATLLASVLLNPTGTAQSYRPSDLAVQVSAHVERSPAAIALSWPGNPFAVSYRVWRKSPEAVAWGNPIAQLPGHTSGFRDGSVSVGLAYEYQIEAGLDDGTKAFGYVYSGIEVPLVENRGKIILLVDANWARHLSAELRRLQDDLIGDGWTVIRETVSRLENVRNIRTLIRNIFFSDPVHTKALLIFGHVPVPYSGDFAADQHSNHRGAWPADVYYADVDGNWTDVSVRSTGAEDPRNWNVPGDGKFDLSFLPSRVELQVGRVDMFDMARFAPRSEVDLLRNYLDKNHAYRHKHFSVSPRALVRDGFGMIGQDAPALDAWRNFAPLVGPENIQTVGAGQFFPTLSAHGYLWSYGGGGGGYEHVDGVGHTGDFTSSAVQTVFSILHGSYFGDWDTPDNFLRAPLAANGYALASIWAGLPHWYLHHMGLGETLGFSTRLVQNNTAGLYRDHVNESAGGVHVALMGDPSLRMHVVAPVSNLQGTRLASGVGLSWTASPDQPAGYYVYRAGTPAEHFARLSPALIAGTTFVDGGAQSGVHTYMVRAVKLERTPSGTFFNGSQGKFITFDSSAPPVPQTVTITAPEPLAAEVGPRTGRFELRRNSPFGALSGRLSISGSALNGTDYQTISQNFVFADGESTRSILVVPIPDNLLEGDETVVLTVEAAAGYQAGSPSSATVLIRDTPNRPPTISSIPDVTLLEGEQWLEVLFTIADPESAPDTLQVSARSSNAELVSENGIAIESGGAVRQLFVTLAPRTTGTARITVEVSDGELLASAEFNVVVLAAGAASPSVEILAEQDVRVRFQSEPARMWSLETSPNLLEWEPLVDLITPGTGWIEYLHPEGASGPSRFYRLTPR